MAEANSEQTSSNGSEGTGSSKWETFSKWWERDQNKVYAVVLVSIGYIVGGVAGELRARRREDRRWARNL